MSDVVSSRTIADSILSSLIHMTQAISHEKNITVEKAKEVIIDFVEKEILSKFDKKEKKTNTESLELANTVIDMTKVLTHGKGDSVYLKSLYTKSLQLKELIKEGR